MRLAVRYSHHNAEEYLQVHHPAMWREIGEAIGSLDAETCRVEYPQDGRLPYSPSAMDRAMVAEVRKRGWAELHRVTWACDDARLLRRIHHLEPEQQRMQIVRAGREPIQSYDRVELVKDRVAVEVEFGQSALVAHDIFVKHMGFYVSDVIDVGVEIVPTRELAAQMPVDVPHYERNLHDILRQGRTAPAVPLVLIGVEP